MMPDEYRVMYEVEDSFWWYRGMRRNLLVLLQRHWDWTAYPTPLILDAGCGTGGILQKMATNFEDTTKAASAKVQTASAVGVDISDQAIKFCRARGLNGSVAQASLVQLPFAKEQFDIVTSFDVACHMPDDKPAFAEVSRVLKRGGIFITNLPAYQFLYSEHDVAVRIKRRYTKKLLAARLDEVGLQIERLTYVNTVLFPPAAVIRLIKNARGHGSNPAEAHSDLTPPPALLNRMLTGMMGLEAQLLRHTTLSLPFGLSVMAVARKA
jgi:SAM-dependent methyltransferase